MVKGASVKPSKNTIDREGVASVVGTILALLVFLTLLGIFINHYVPAMMAGNEHQHDETVISQLLQLKENIDDMILYSAAQHSSTLSEYSSITLGSSGVPMFATGTEGQLNVMPQTPDTPPSISLNFIYTVPGTSEVYHSTVSAGGGIYVNMPNRYYIPQTAMYENDAVIVGQQNGQFMVSNPGFSVSAQGGIHLSILLVTISTPNAQNLTYAGLNSVGMTAQLLGYSSSSYNLATGSSFVLTVTTPYQQAWSSYFNQTLSSAGLTSGTGGNYTMTQVRDGFNFYVLTLTVRGALYLTLSRAIINVNAEE